MQTQQIRTLPFYMLQIFLPPVDRTRDKLGDLPSAIANALSFPHFVSGLVISLCYVGTVQKPCMLQ